MKANTASRTAQYMALFRAIESARPKGERLFNDPFATSFLDLGLKAAVSFSTLPIVGSIIPKVIQQRGPGALSSGIARTRYIDELIGTTILTGNKQVIILGAGFDTRALRLKCLKDIRVIEIDHPDTSKFKLRQLKTFMRQLPANITFQQIDFNNQTLNDIAPNSGIDFDVPTTILWEGVTNYLSQEAIDATLSFSQRFTDKLNFIFTYIDKAVLDNPKQFEGTDKLFQNLKDNEEKWTFGFNQLNYQPTSTNSTCN